MKKEHSAEKANQNQQPVENPQTDMLTELTNDLQRTRADFENYRKQTEVQKENEKKSARLSTVFKLLPLLDDLDRAIATYSELAPLSKSLEKSLKDLNLIKINSNPGTEFNPDLHDAVMVEGEGEKEIIEETLRPGYYYESEVLRPAMVKVKRES
jgi:molecular chaperone GrpE